MSLKRSSLMFAGLVAVTLLASVVPYERVYAGHHNSLFYDAAYLIGLTALIALYPNDFIRFMRSKRTGLPGLAAAVLILFVIDYAINRPFNLYKFKMYALLYAMYVLAFLFTKLREDQKARLLGYLMVTWLAASWVELYLRFTRPHLFKVFPWNAMTLQSAFNDLARSGYIDPVMLNVYGLGIGSQANIVAMLTVVLLVVTARRSLPWPFRFRLFAFVFLLAAVVIMPFTLSLTAILAFACAVIVVLLRAAVHFTAKATLGVSAVAAGAIGIFSFEIGDVFGFAAATQHQEKYLRELVYWPIQYLQQNAVRVVLGLQNDLTNAPLENRYFNVVLALGLPISIYVGVSVFRIFRGLLRRSRYERHGTLKLMLFVLICVSYAHIAFASHLPGLVFFATIFVFSAANATAPPEPIQRMAVEIRTARFLLRELDTSDVTDRYLGWLRDPSAERHVTVAAATTTLDELRDYVAARVGRPDVLFLGIFNRASGVHIGNIKYEPIDSAKGYAVMGILIGDPDYRGSGVAAEVLNASAAWLHEHRQVDQIVAGVSTENPAAIRAYEKVGFAIADTPFIKKWRADQMTMVWQLTAAGHR